MIYNRWGSSVTFTRNCGKHAGMTLCRAVVTDFPDTESESKRARFVFAETCRADGGLNEVMQAANAAPSETLSDRELKGAIESAS